MAFLKMISFHDTSVSVLAFIFVRLLLVSPLLYLIYDYTRILLLRRKLPPGPIPLPIFGSYFITPKAKPWVTWERWSKQYDNPMITIWNGHRPCIVCHDAWTVSDLMEKRAAIYSSRPRMPSMGDMVSTLSFLAQYVYRGTRLQIMALVLYSVLLDSSLNTC